MLVFDNNINLSTGERSFVAVHVHAHDVRRGDKASRDHDPPLAERVELRAPYVQEATR